MNKADWQKVILDPYVIIMAIFILLIGPLIIIVLHLELCGRLFCGMDSL